MKKPVWACVLAVGLFGSVSLFLAPMAHLPIGTYLASICSFGRFVICPNKALCVTTGCHSAPKKPLRNSRKHKVFYRPAAGEFVIYQRLQGDSIRIATGSRCQWCEALPSSLSAAAQAKAAGQLAIDRASDKPLTAQRTTNKWFALPSGERKIKRFAERS